MSRPPWLVRCRCRACGPAGRLRPAYELPVDDDVEPPPWLVRCRCRACGPAGRLVPAYELPEGQEARLPVDEDRVLLRALETLARRHLDKLAGYGSVPELHAAITRAVVARGGARYLAGALTRKVLRWIGAMPHKRRAAAIAAALAAAEARKAAKQRLRAQPLRPAPPVAGGARDPRLAVPAPLSAPAPEMTRD